MASFIQTIDSSMKTLVYTKFGPYLDLTGNQNKDLVFAPKSLALRKIAEKRGENSVEFISLWRNSVTFDWERQNTPIARRGISLEYEDSTTKQKIVTVKGVPIIIDYDIFLWSKCLDKVTEATEIYMQWLHNTPNLVLYYNGRYEMDMYIKMRDVVDETDYDIYNKGQYFVTKFNIKLDAWALSMTSIRTVLKIILDIYLREGQKPNYVDTLLNEYIIEAP
jgi:hypothetical protein